MLIHYLPCPFNCAQIGIILNQTEASGFSLIEYRRNRRVRNTWYRKPRFLNRKKPEGWLAPSIQHKLDSHIRIIHQVKAILPVSQINLVDQLRALGNMVNHTYGYATKSGRIALGLAKSHVNDAFVIAGGREQGRNETFAVRQNRRNNRGLQLNRKGFAPSIRRKRYGYQPGDMVSFDKNIYKVKGMFNYGKWVRVADKVGKPLDIAAKRVCLLKYQKGFAFEH